MSLSWHGCLTTTGRKTSGGVNRSAGADRVCQCLAGKHQREVEELSRAGVAG